MITDCNLYSQTYVLEKKKNIFINGYQLKHALHVIYLFYRHNFLLVHKTTYNTSVSTE